MGGLELTRRISVIKGGNSDQWELIWSMQRHEVCYPIHDQTSPCREADEATVLTNGAVTVTLTARVARDEGVYGGAGGLDRPPPEAIHAAKKSSLIPRRRIIPHRLRALRLVRDKILRWNAHYRVPFKKMSRPDHALGRLFGVRDFEFQLQNFFFPNSSLIILSSTSCVTCAMNHSRRFWQLVAETVRIIVSEGGNCGAFISIMHSRKDQGLVY